MHPILIHFGPVTLYTYGVLVATGVLLGLWYARHYAPRAGLDPDRVWNLGIYMVLAGLVVAKLWLIALYFDYYRAHPSEMFALSTLQSGGTFYGGFFGGLFVLLFYTWRYKIPLLPLMDTYSAALPLGHAIGRLGCFTAGCCYGKPTWLPWGVTFRNPIAAQIVGTPLGIALHPTQLYEAIAEMANFFFLMWLSRRQRFTGQIFASYMILYGVERALIEIVRGDPDRTLMFNGKLSLMQLVSLGLIAIGSFVYYRGTRRSLLPAHAHK